jgi:hypothetical protein
MDKKAFAQYYEQVKDVVDKESVLCEYVHVSFTIQFQSLWFLFSHAFAVFDANKDGTIDFKEFLLAIAVETADSVDSNLDFCFQMSV